jgi:diguanylate cyclase (GGDEF)-like protein
MVLLDLQNVGALLKHDEQLIKQHYPVVSEKEAQLFKKVEAWIEENLFCDCSELALDIRHFLNLVLTGEFSTRYQELYQNIIHWRHKGLKKTEAIVILGQLRQLMIELGSERSPELAKSYCHLLDITIGLIVTVYQIDEEAERLKLHMQGELKRVDRTFAILGLEVPAYLTRPYVDHVKWLTTVMELAIGDVKSEGVHLALDEHECRLGKWLDGGGRETFCEDKRRALDEAHHQVHALARQALDYVEERRLDKVLDIVHDLKCASEQVSEILLDKVEEVFVKQAISDGLTGLPNRRLFDLNFKKRRAFARRHQYYLGLIILDIDHFKSVNDTYGHQVGDKVLHKMASILQSAVREEEDVYRWGGEEFAVLLVSPAADAAQKLAERIRLSVEQAVFCKGTQAEIHKTVSGGALSVAPEVDIPEHELFALSDKLLYQAKTNGRNQIVSQVLEGDKP